MNTTPFHWDLLPSLPTSFPVQVISNDLLIQEGVAVQNDGFLEISIGGELKHVLSSADFPYDDEIFIEGEGIGHKIHVSHTLIGKLLNKEE